MRRPRGFVAGVALWVLTTGAAAGCRETAPPPPPLAPVVDIKRLMSGMVDPSADVVWQSVAITIDRTGEQHKRPTTNDEWLVVQNHAMIVAESANLMMIAPRARDDGEWMRMSRVMREAAAKAYEASQRQDADALLTIGGEMYDACAACHKKYLPPGEEDPI